MSRKLSDLKEAVRARAETSLEELKIIGVPCAVTSTLRLELEQIALSAQGRETLEVVNGKRATAGMAPITEKENRYTVTNCDGIKKKSPHQGGRAIDVVPTENGRPVWPPLSDPRWKQISTVFKKNGFEWGGDWKEFPDPPHYQFGA